MAEAKEKYVVENEKEKLMTVTPWMLRSVGRAAYTTKVASRKIAETICKYANIVTDSSRSCVSLLVGKQMRPFKSYTIRMLTINLLIKELIVLLYMNEIPLDCY